MMLSTTTPRIYFLRHASTKFDNAKEEMAQGWIKEGLDDRGRSEARMCAKRLEKYPISKIVTTDLPRGKETAEIIGKHLGIKVIPARALRCWDLGVLAGKPESEVNPILAELMTKHPGEKIPGGEAFDDYRKRFMRHVEMQMKQGGSLLDVTHSKNIHMVLARKPDGAVDVAKCADPPHIGPCELYLFSHPGEEWTVRKVSGGKS